MGKVREGGKGCEYRLGLRDLPSLKEEGEAGVSTMLKEIGAGTMMVTGRG